MALRLCATPHCGATVAAGHCQAHRRARDKARGTSRERHYDSRWARFSLRWRQQHPRCGERADGKLYAEHSRCVAEGRITAAEAVDHMVSMANGGEQYDPANLQSLCMSCNARKRNMFEARR